MSTDLENEIGKFAMCLRRARREAGDPPYRELARRTTYSISSISRTFNGATFPRWRFTELLLKSCDVSEEQIDGYWRRRWLQAAEALSPLGGGAEADGPPAPDRSARQLDDDRTAARWQECAECGSLVAKPLLHRAWHLNYMRQPVGKTRVAAG
ncbi:MAG: helix-turn-helix domain-containing protein [Streptosporangiaceae bacterium]